MNHSLLSLFAVSLGLAAVALAEDAPKNYATSPVPREGGWMKQHESFNAVSKKGEAPLVFLGDSITAGWAGKGKEEWTKSWAPPACCQLWHRRRPHGACALASGARQLRRPQAKARRAHDRHQ